MKIHRPTLMMNDWDGVDPRIRKRMKDRFYTISHQNANYIVQNYTDNWGGVLKFSNRKEQQSSNESIYLACGTHDTKSLNIIKFDPQMTSHQLCCHLEKYHDHFIHRLVWSNDNQHIYSTSSDSTVCKVNVNKQQLSSVVNCRNYGAAIGICVPPESESPLAYFCTKSAILLWDSRTSGQNSLLTKIHHVQNLQTASDGHPVAGDYIDCCMKDEQILVTCNRHGVINWWDLRMNSDAAHTIVDLYSNSINSICFSKHNDLLIYNDEGVIFEFNQNHIIDTNTLQQIPRLKQYNGPQNMYDLRIASYSYNNNYIIAGNDLGTVCIWNRHTCELVSTIENKYNEDQRIVSAWFAPVDDEDNTIALSYQNSCYTYKVDYNETQNKREGKEFSDHVFYADNGASVEEEPWQEDPSGWIRYADCTYSQSYINQIVFICLTCSATNPDMRAGLCSQCAKFCHELKGHEVYNIGMKCRFKCDCGTQKFNEPCCLLEKSGLNDKNKYNHNFRNEWCYCNQPEVRPMYQCLGCEDWFHGSCLGIGGVIQVPEDMSYVCDNCCNGSMNFLREYPIHNFTWQVAPFNASHVVSGRPKLGIKIQRGRFLPMTWKNLVLPQHLEAFKLKDTVNEVVHTLIPKRKQNPTPVVVPQQPVASTSNIAIDDQKEDISSSSSEEESDSDQSVDGS